MPATNYYYRVRSVNGINVSENSNVIAVLTCSFPGQTGIKNLSAKKNTVYTTKLQVMPNPSNSSFTLLVNSHSTAAVDITVSDMFGIRVYTTQGPSNKTYNFGQNFTSGLYVVKVVQEKTISIIKVVKCSKL